MELFKGSTFFFLHFCFYFVEIFAFLLCWNFYFVEKVRMIIERKLHLSWSLKEHSIQLFSNVNICGGHGINGLSGPLGICCWMCQLCPLNTYIFILILGKGSWPGFPFHCAPALGCSHTVHWPHPSLAGSLSLTLSLGQRLLSLLCIPFALCTFSQTSAQHL